MERIILSVFLLTISVSWGYSQGDQPTESQLLSQQIGALYQQGKFGEAIPLAEKVVAIEKGVSKTSEGYAISLMNLAMLHKERMRQIKGQLQASRIEDVKKAYDTINDDAKDAEKLMRDSLKIYQQLSLDDGLSAASLKYELAWLLSNHQTFTLTPVNVKEKIDEAEKLYTEALATQEKAAGNENDPALRTVLALGDFYTRWINFEKALPYYERYVAVYEKKLGVNSKALIPALRGILEIMVISDRKSEAQNVITRIGTLSGKNEILPSPVPNLALRARKLEKVTDTKFIPPERSNDFSFIFSQAVGTRAFSPMGAFQTKSVIVNIVVDENGDVIEANVDKAIKSKQVIEAAAMKSKFRPFSYKGTSYKMRGSIMYAYID